MKNSMSSSTNGNGVSKRDNTDKAKSPSGWMAFDLNQRRKERGLDHHNDSEAYPVLSSVDAPKSLIDKNRSLLQKPFSSVVVVPKDVPSLIDTRNFGSEVSVKYDQNKLKYFHTLEDDSLIDDILAGVDNNVDEALSLIESMFISENEANDIKKVESSGNSFELSDVRGSSSVENTDMSFVTGVPSEYEPLSVLLLGSSESVPIEPEWEEDDVYLVHRKDAIKAIRSASRHSKAANDAYIKGDHKSAQRYSHIAKEEWIMARKLNAKAAKEILSMRNCKNDLWTLDLHGLHSLEAVEALRDRLQTVESLVSSNCSAALGGVHKESGLLAGSVQPKNQIKMEKFGGQRLSTRPRQMFLQVITGKGNHSRRGVALPTAIRNFLNENGYHFDETRPGALMVRPKFRKQ